MAPPRRGADQGESVYAWAGLAEMLPPVAQQAGGPRVKTYNVAAPSAPKPKMHVDSSQVESILNPVRGIRDAQARAGITPTNHSRHNILAIKEQSRMNALHKLAAAEEQQAAAAQAFRPQLRKTTSGAGTPGCISRSASGGGSRDLPRSSSGGSGGGRNFVEENKAAAVAALRPVKAEARGGGDAGAYLSKSEYGQVPAYLLERKMELAQQQAALLAAKAAAAIPPGLRQLPESERLQTLALLEGNRAEVEARLAALPIVIETHSQRRHKEELERRLAEIGEARRIFSRPGVLVHADS